MTDRHSIFLFTVTKISVEYAHFKLFFKEVNSVQVPVPHEQVKREESPAKTGDSTVPPLSVRRSAANHWLKAGKVHASFVLLT